jgi:hypothetical protein
MSKKKCIPAIVLYDSGVSSLHEPVAMAQANAPRVYKKKTNVQEPTPVVEKESFDVTPHEVYFDMVMSSTIAHQNMKVDRLYFTVRKEGKLKWTIMGLGCEYALVTLHETYGSFHIEALLPRHAELAFCIPAEGINEVDIHCAMLAVFRGH